MPHKAYIMLLLKYVAASRCFVSSSVWLCLHKQKLQITRWWWHLYVALPVEIYHTERGRIRKGGRRVHCFHPTFGGSQTSGSSSSVAAHLSVVSAVFLPRCVFLFRVFVANNGPEIAPRWKADPIWWQWFVRLILGWAIHKRWLDL